LHRPVSRVRPAPDGQAGARNLAWPPPVVVGSGATRDLGRAGSGVRQSTAVGGIPRAGRHDLRQESAYRAAGMDVDAGDRVKEQIGPAVRATFGPRVLTDVGPLSAFGGMYAVGDLGLRDPVLVGSADGVGTKL